MKNVEVKNMKINFKTILIIFLVALLGGSIGTYGILELNKYQNEIVEKEDNVVKTQDSVTEQVLYTNENSGTYVNAIEKALDSVVEITSQSEVTSYYFFGGTTTSEATNLGSGVIISSDGYIVTNRHVVKEAKKVSVSLQNGETYEAQIIGEDSKTDLALLKIDATDLDYALLVDSDTLKLGQEVVAIGNGLGKGTASSNGIISALNREVTIDKYTMTLILTNAEINNGNSGGGLFDLNGNLVGIVNAKSSSSALYSNTATIEGIGYAIPANTVKKITDDLLENGYVKNRPTLGVSIYTSDYNEYYGIEGLVISDVMENGAAAKAGLQAGDIIKALDGVELTDFSQLAKLLDDYNVGDTVTLDVVRNNSSLKINCVLQDASN